MFPFSLIKVSGNQCSRFSDGERCYTGPHQLSAGEKKKHRRSAEQTRLPACTETEHELIRKSMAIIPGLKFRDSSGIQSASKCKTSYTSCRNEDASTGELKIRAFGTKSAAQKPWASIPRRDSRRQFMKLLVIGLAASGSVHGN